MYYDKLVFFLIFKKSFTSPPTFSGINELDSYLCVLPTYTETKNCTPSDYHLLGQDFEGYGNNAGHELGASIGSFSFGKEYTTVVDVIKSGGGGHRLSQQQ